MDSQHLFKFSRLSPSEETKGGLRYTANKKNFPILKGMSFYKLILHPKGLREPHWHANADELGYCLKGEAIITLYHTSDTKATFLVKGGEMFFIPSGALHHIENVGEGPSEFILCFSNEDVEEFGISGTLGTFSNAVLGNTWNVAAETFKPLPHLTTNVFAALQDTSASVPEHARYTTPYRFSIEDSEPILTNTGGSARMARQNYWPILRSQALYSLVLTGEGMREPHWHPETAELGYVEKGRGRMSILSPSGKVDTYVMEEGDIYFIPKAYPHHIENLKDESLHLLIYFDQPMPEDIGFTGSVRSYSNAVLGAVTATDPALFEKLEKYYYDLFIVKKVNPLDSVLPSDVYPNKESSRAENKII